MGDDLLRWVWRTLIFARGAVAAVTFVAVMDGLFGISRVSFLEFTHSIVVHWEFVLRQIISPIFVLFPNFPAPSQLSLNILTLGLCLVPFVLGAKLAAFERSPSSRYIYAILCVMPAAYNWQIDDAQSGFDKLLHLFPQLILLFAFAFAVLLGLRSPRGSLSSAYATAILFGGFFILTCEVLYFLPLFENFAADFVERAVEFERNSAH